jgi:hypothetical protein
MTNFELEKFHGLTVAQLLPDESIAFGQVKNSLTGTSLSGNWLFSQKDSDAISSVCRSHILISNMVTLERITRSSSQNIFYGNFDDFVSSIKSDEENLRIEWEAHLQENPKKAKTLVSPTWANWKNTLSVEDPIGSLIASGRSAHPDSTPDDMKSLIALARMARHVLDIWRELENSRISRKFLKGSREAERLWPHNWQIERLRSK